MPLTKRDLVAALEDYPDDAVIHLDVSEPYEGDRVVRTLAGIRPQYGYNAVALDADDLPTSNTNYGDPL